MEKELLDPSSNPDFTSRTIMKSMKSHLQCPSCNLLIEDPRVLVCSHTFCRECLEKIAKREKPTDEQKKTDEDEKLEGAACMSESPTETVYILCPDCGVRTDVPGGDFSQLQYNFFIQHLMDLMYYNSSDPIPLVYCGMCRKDGVKELPPAVARCSTCAVFLCKDCFELHSIDDFMKLHTTHSITERRQSGVFSFIVSDETAVRNCKKHNWKIFTYFCTTCGRGICETCAKEEHKMHQYSKAEELRSEYAAYIRELISRTSRLQRRTETAIRSTQDLMSGIQLLAATQIEEVLRQQDILTSSLEGRLSMLLQEAEKCASENKASESKASENKTSESKASKNSESSNGKATAVGTRAAKSKSDDKTKEKSKSNKSEENS